METNVIYNDVCLETLAKMEDNSIDLIITSPPYNKNFYAPSGKGGWIRFGLRCVVGCLRMVRK